MTNFSSGLFIVKIRAESTRFLAKIRVIFPRWPDFWAHPDFSVQLIHISHLDPPANGQAVIHLTGLLEVFISELTIFGNSIGQLCPLSSRQCGQKIENKHKWSKK